MRRFLLKFFALAAIPLILTGIAYTALDPLKVIHADARFFEDGLGVNKGVVTVRTFRNCNPYMHYDSFILGSSLTCYYELDAWKQYLPSGARPFHFDSSNQPLSTLRRSLEYLEANADSLNNILIVLDPFIFDIPDDMPDMVYLDPPEFRPGPVYGTYFHYKMFRHFLNIHYLYSYIPFECTGVRNMSAPNPIFDIQPIVWDKEKNEETLPQWDESIARRPAEFYERHALRAPGESYYAAPEPQLSAAQIEDLKKIAEILRRNSCSYRVVVGPDRRRQVLNDRDEAVLDSIFGESFFNLGREFYDEMADSTNFYDNTHYRSTVSNKILDRIYRGRGKSMQDNEL